jgi:hypothetical protein
MTRRSIRSFLVPFAILAGSVSSLVAQPRLVVSAVSGNDLVQVLGHAGYPVVRVETPAAAVERAPQGGAVMILADGYPETPTPVDAALFAAAAAKNLRLYVEFPELVPGHEVGGIHRAGIYDRAVVTSDFFGDALAAMRILTVNGCRMVSLDAGSPHLVFAKVAGYDTAAYGLANTSAQPLLFEPQPGRLLVSTTKLSHFVTGRYGPKEAWRQVWTRILQWLDPARDPTGLDWIETVRPMFGPDEPLPADAVARAVESGTDWFSNGRFLVGESWKDLPHHQRATASEFGPHPGEEFPAGDGRFSILEGHASRIDWDGTQQYRYCRRGDCQAESAFALTMRSRLIGDPQSRRIAANLLDYLYLTSPLRQGPRNDPASGSYGLVGWGAYPASQVHYYGDDNARIFLGSIGAVANLDSTKWDRQILELILANFRTTGAHGFRGANLQERDLQRNGWLPYWQSGKINLHPHFEAWIWTSYLWLYHKVGDELLLNRTKGAIRRMMEAYPKWNWTNGIQQERGRMILTLAWLIRVDDTPEHRAWLKQVAADMLSHMGPEGAIQEEVGAEGGSYGPPASNAAYGTSETPLIHENGDPAADMLYTMNFAFFGLNEAARATGDPFYRDALDRMADFLLRIQARSESHADLHGAWFRGFDTARWEFWGSNGDHGWGVWGTLTGWTQSWIVATLAMKKLNTSLWEITADSKIGKLYPEVRARMLPDSAVDAALGREIRHLASGRAVRLETPPDPRYPGNGAEGLIDGRLGTDTHNSPTWLGFEGREMTATLDLGSRVPIEQLGLHTLRNPKLGIHWPERVEFLISGDGVEFKTAAVLGPQDGGAASGMMLSARLEGVSGRHLRVRAVPPATIPDGQPAAGRPAWIFLSEIIVNPGPDHTPAE